MYKNLLYDKIYNYLIEGFHKSISPVVLGCSLLFNTLELKSDMSKISSYDFVPLTKSGVLVNLIKNKKYFLSDVKTLENVVKYIKVIDKNRYVDNEFYKSIRINEAKKEIQKYSIKSNVLVIDKTFQKALLFDKKFDEEIIDKDKSSNGFFNNPYIDSSDVFSKNYSLDDYLYLHDLSGYEFINEYDCSTAFIHGKKQRAGDGKTPEGVFEIHSIEVAHNKLWDNKKVYGPYFIRIQGSIGIHGTGTDTNRVKNWFNDSHYADPEPLGVYLDKSGEYKIGVGKSHGCIRLDNSVVRYLVDNNIITKETKVIIYENKKMTEILKSVY